MARDKLSGLTISGNLSWNDHITDEISKASKRLYLYLLCS